MFKIFSITHSKHWGHGHDDHGHGHDDHAHWDHGWHDDHGNEGHGHEDHSGHGKKHSGHGHGDHGHDTHHGHHSSPVEVRMEDGDIVEEELGQVALDILDCSDMIIIMAPIAGMDTENIDISVSRNILTISGERVRPDAYDVCDRILVEECFFGPFSRSVILPENLAFNKIHATMENNLLKIEVPKLMFSEKTIKINKLQS